MTLHQTLYRGEGLLLSRAALFDRRNTVQATHVLLNVLGAMFKKYKERGN